MAFQINPSAKQQNNHMDTQDQKTAEEIKSLFNEIIAIHNLNEDQKKDVFEKLEGSIYLNLTSHLLDSLPENSKAELKQKEFKTNKELLEYLSGKTPKDKFQNAIFQSTDEILTKFLEKI